MLDPWIIEEIKRREQRGRIEQPTLEIPAHGPDPRDRRDRGNTGNSESGNGEEETPRGIAIIDYGVACW